MKKFLPVLVGYVIMIGLPFTYAATYSSELEDSYNRAYENGIISESTIDDANLYDALTNLELADILNKYVENIFGEVPDTDKTCTFDDLSDLTSNERSIVIKSCQLGILPADKSTTSFNPNDKANLITFGTALSRVLWGSLYDGGTPYYINHLNAIKAAGLINQIDEPEDRTQIKGYTLLILKRSIESDRTVESNVITLKPGLNTFSTPAILNSISFSNGGSNISFAKMEKGKWTPISVNNNNKKSTIKPLDGYIIRNSNSVDVIMTLEYDTNNSDSLILSKELDAGWNFLGITTTDNPFANIASAVATMKLDFTNGLITNLIQIGKTFKNATNYMLGKAYAVFVNNSGTYGGINNYDGNNTQTDCDDPVVKAACLLESEACPEVCKNDIMFEKCDLNEDNTVNASDQVRFNNACIKEIMGETNDDNGDNDATLTNNLSKSVEFPAGEVNQKIVFDGTYKALNDTSINMWRIDDIYDFSIEDNASYFEERCERNQLNMEFKLYINRKFIDKMLINDACNFGKGAGAGLRFDEIEIKKGESIDVEVWVEIEGNIQGNDTYKTKLTLLHQNKPDDSIFERFGEAGANLAPIEIIDQDSFTITTQSQKKTVNLQKSESKFATFTLNPINSEGYLNTITVHNWNDLSCDNVELKIDGAQMECSSDGADLKYDIDTEVNSSGVHAEILLKGDYNGTIMLGIMEINGHYNYEDGATVPLEIFTNGFENALVYIESQVDKGSQTEYKLRVEKTDDDDKVLNVKLYKGTNYNGENADSFVCEDELGAVNNEVKDGMIFSVENKSSNVIPIYCIEYDIFHEGGTRTVKIAKHEYPDYFQVNGESRRVFATEK